MVNYFFTASEIENGLQCESTRFVMSVIKVIWSLYEKKKKKCTFPSHKFHCIELSILYSHTKISRNKRQCISGNLAFLLDDVWRTKFFVRLEAVAGVKRIRTGV